MSDDRPETLEQAAREVQAHLWVELMEAMDSAHSGGWSMHCDHFAHSIVSLARFVGATSWEEVSVRMLRSGAYERVLREAGVSYEPIGWDEVAATERRIADGSFYTGNAR